MNCGEIEHGIEQPKRDESREYHAIGPRRVIRQVGERRPRSKPNVEAPRAKPELLAEIDIAKRLFLETNTVTPLLQRMEKEGIITRAKGSEDGRQKIVSLTRKGKALKKELANVPSAVGSAVACESVKPETAPELFRMLDDIIAKLDAKQE